MQNQILARSCKASRGFPCDSCIPRAGFGILQDFENIHVASIQLETNYSALTWAIGDKLNISYNLSARWVKTQCFKGTSFTILPSFHLLFEVKKETKSAKAYQTLFSFSISQTYSFFHKLHLCKKWKRQSTRVYNTCCEGSTMWMASFL